MSSAVDAVIARVLGIPTELLTDELYYQSVIEWSSLAHVELMLALEEELGLSISDEQVGALNNVAAIRLYASNASITETSPAREAGQDPTQPELRRGLNGVLLDDTSITMISGADGTLHYRGYAIADLARTASYEETAYLLIHGELPTATELADFDDRLRTTRQLPDAVIELIKAMRASRPIDVLRTSVSLLGGLESEQVDDSPEQLLTAGIRIIARMPTIIAAHHAVRMRSPITPPDPTLGHSANFLFMLKGIQAKSDVVRILDQNLVLQADHGCNASAFAARVAAGTGSGIVDALTTALGVFGGRLHGGAIQEVGRVVEEIGDPESAHDYMMSLRAKKEPAMGFGHRIYRTEDPRAPFMQSGAERLSEARGDRRELDILEEMRRAMEPYNRHGLHVNVDFYGGVLYGLLGLEQDTYCPVFAMARSAGWIAQYLEQRDNNILIRPQLRYVGPPPRSWIDLEDRE